MDKTIKNRNPHIEKLRTIINIFLEKKKKENISSEKQQLLNDIEDALSDLRYARSCFSSATDPEMIEACIYEIKSAESRYSFLLRKAKRMAAKESGTAI